MRSFTSLNYANCKLGQVRQSTSLSIHKEVNSGIFLFVVEKSYQGNKGLTLLPGIPLHDKRPEVRSIIQGIELELRLPNGTRRQTYLVTYGISVEKAEDSSILIHGELEDQFVHFILPEGLTPVDIPAGTEVWLP